MASRDGSNEIKTAIARKILREFDVTNVFDISEIPIVTIDRPTPLTPEPFIYVGQPDTDESDVTKSNSARDYNIPIRVATSTLHNTSTEQTRNDIMDELVRILDVQSDNYIDLTNSGYNVRVQNADIGSSGVREARGKTYFISNLTVEIRADFIGLPSDRSPVQRSSYTFTNFTLAPNDNARLIEVGDGGTITGALTYPSGNDGWDFVSVAYIVPTGSQGSLTDNVLTIDSDDDPINLQATLNYQFSTSTSITTSITNIDNFRRIRSVRYGAINQSSISQADLDNFALFQGTNKTFDFGNVSPIGDTLRFEGVAGDRFYIVYDSSLSVRSITDQLGNNNIGAFTETTVGQYKVLLQNNPLVYDTSAPVQYTIR